MKHVYLSGSVTGLDRREAEENFLIGERVARSAFGFDCEVFNPVKEVPEAATHEQAMTICLSELAGMLAVDDGKIAGPGYDAMVIVATEDVLSEGVCAEVVFAWATGIPMYVVENLAYGSGFTEVKLTKVRFSGNALLVREDD